MWKTAVLVAGLVIATGLVAVALIAFLGVGSDLAIGLALVATAIPWLFLLRWSQRSWSRLAPDGWTCTECGYDLGPSARTRGACPECGHGYDWEELQFRWQHLTTARDATPEAAAPPTDR